MWTGHGEVVRSNISKVKANRRKYITNYELWWWKLTKPHSEIYILTKFLTLSSTNSPQFVEYFKTSYCSHIEQWAMCYRVGTPMNTNMFSESFHRVLKIVYLQHKQNKRVDHLIHILLKVARDKAFEQLQKSEKGKHTHRICDINKRHQAAMSFAVLATVEDIGNCTHKVSSQSLCGKYYTVQTIQESCNCQMKCQFCSACAHYYILLYMPGCLYKHHCMQTHAFSTATKTA